MDEKYDSKYEDRVKLLAELRLEHKNFKVFDYRARVIKRENFSTLDSEEKNALVIINAEDDVIILTEEFERMLYMVSKNRFE